MHWRELSHQRSWRRQANRLVDPRCLFPLVEWWVQAADPLHFADTGTQFKPWIQGRKHVTHWWGSCRKPAQCAAREADRATIPAVWWWRLWGLWGLLRTKRKQALQKLLKHLQQLTQVYNRRNSMRNRYLSDFLRFDKGHCRFEGERVFVPHSDVWPGDSGEDLWRNDWRGPKLVHQSQRSNPERQRRFLCHLLHRRW